MRDEKMPLKVKLTMLFVGLCFIIAASLEPTVGNHIHEDDPNWNCQTMGNLICGSGN